MRHVLTVAVPSGQLGTVLTALDPTGATVLTVDPPEPAVRWTARVVLEWVDGPCTEQDAHIQLREDLEALAEVLTNRPRLERLTVNEQLSHEMVDPLDEDPDTAALLEWRRRRMPREE